MAKTTLYHPISLYTLRGAAQWGGFVLGQIKQLESDVENQCAYYAVTLKVIPSNLRKAHPEKVREVLNNCFASDVIVLGISYSTHGGFTCTIKTDILAAQTALPEARNEILESED